MAAATTVRTYRPPNIARFLTVPTYADLVLNGTTIYPGEYVRVVSTNKLYLCTGPEDFLEVGASSGGSGATASSFTGVDTNFADLVGKAVGNTDASAQLASGVTIHGQGIAEIDSGVTVAMGLGGPVASLLTTNEAAHTVALSVGGTTEVWKPGTHGPLHVYAEVAMDTALTDRAFFIGFHGAHADAQDPVVTGATVTITLVEDDCVGLFFDSGLTDGDRLFFPYNKADAAATIATTATGVDTGSDFPAAGTYTKLEVVVLADGTAIAYVDGSEVTRIASALTPTTAVNPICYVESNAAAIKTMLVKRFAAWAENQ